MRRIQFTEVEVSEFKTDRLEHQHPIVRRRMAALYLKSLGFRHKDICADLNISSE